MSVETQPQAQPGFSGQGGTRAVLELMARGGVLDAGTMASNGVNPDPVGEPGWGPIQGPQEGQQYVSGQTQNRPHNYSAEPRIGLPLFGHYPRVLNVNPYRNAGVLHPMGQNVAALLRQPLDVYRGYRAAYFQEGYATSQLGRRSRARQRLAPIVEDPTSIPWTETVPPVRTTSSTVPVW